MSKKILAMFMATAMAATTFFGCGSTEEASKKDEGSSTTSTDEDASTKTDDEKVTLEVNIHMLQSNRLILVVNVSKS